MRRHLLGILAVILIVLGLVLMGAGGNKFLASSSWRIGLVLGVLWLAFPQLEGFARWFRTAAIVVAVVAAALSKYALILLPLLFLMWIFGRRKPADVDTKQARREAGR